MITQDSRLVKLTPSKNWGDNSSILGVTIRFESYLDAHHNILAVKDVYLDSPAHEAGLLSYKDFILGTREICFKSLDEFAKLVEVNESRELTLYVYNVDSETVRECKIIPSKTWGGNGLLGCDVSYGFLNKIPLRKKDLERLNEKKNF